MTKVSERFANSVANLVEGVQVISDMVILSPASHLVRGILFERTPNKNCYYLWKLVVPLFSPLMPNLSLNYSQRLDIGGGGVITIDGKCPELAENVKNKFYSIFENRTGPEREIEEFLQMVGEMGKIRSNMMLETAIAYGINGNFEEACRRLEDVLSLHITSPTISKVQEIAKEVLVAIRQKNDSFAYLVKKWECRNIQSHFPGLLLENRTLG